MALTAQQPDDRSTRPSAPAGTDRPPDDGDVELVLPCGRSVSGVWEHVREGRLDEHEEACPSCQEAVAEFAVLQRATGELKAAEVDVPASLNRSVMDRVRTELRLGRLIPIGEPEEFACVAESAVAAVLREGVDRLAGVRARGCRIAPPRNQAGAAVPGPVTVHLDLSVAYGVDIPRTADAVRARVHALARDAVGIPVEVVHVAVVDLWDDQAPPAGARDNRRTGVRA